ncbi:ABC transporter substrate-binding protein [Roseateles amylovorans]|uniref:ABC transporter substrate-binding protein n=1 Tax=Roseateles amylovorans TaxID=2978473 RepID=A0ABY6ATG2_9BURK|nr:ABC transporter substrate-binding protein [Roseateles amylovorans]UXH76511.1 ABC transporter substrate-binding protein [Roseateles amylovorans]
MNTEPTLRLPRAADRLRQWATLALMGAAIGLHALPSAHAARDATTAKAPSPTAASPTLARIKRSGELRVCIWPDYYGITFRNPRNGQLGGIDIDLSAALAKDLGAQLHYVESSFGTLADDLTGSRCDIAMFAVGITPQRRERLAFSAPYLQSDIYAVTTRANRVVKRWEDIDRPGVVVAVQAGTFMEPVMADRLKQATLQVVRPPATREAELEAGRVDVFMTDYPYSRRLLDNADWMRLVSPPAPFHVLPYGYAVRPGDAAWLARVNEFVAAIQRDGRLEAAASRHGLSAIVVH